MERSCVPCCQSIFPHKRGPSASWGPPRLSGRYPVSSTQPPGTIPAVFWPQNRAEQLVLSSVTSLPTIITWCCGEITKREGFCLVLNGIKHLQPSSITKDAKKRKEKKKVPLLQLFLLNLERFLDQSSKSCKFMEGALAMLSEE